MTQPLAPDPTSRPGRLVAVTGTGTGIGKTWVAAAVLGELRAGGQRVAARKPAQSFDPHDPAPTDAAVLAAATGEPVERVCPPQRSYLAPLAPPMAAEALGGLPFTVGDLAQELAASWPAGPPLDVALVEGAGGVASPQATDGDMADLVEAIAADLVVLVAGADLGTINLVRLSLAALGDRRPVLVHLNRYDPAEDLHRRNHAWLTGHEHLAVTTDIPTLAKTIGPRAPSASGS